MRCTGVVGISVSWRSIHFIHLVLQPVTILMSLLGGFHFVDISPVPGESNLVTLVPLGTILFQMIPFAFEPTLASTEPKLFQNLED